MIAVSPLGGASGYSAPSTSFIRKTPPSKGVPAAGYRADSDGPFFSTELKQQSRLAIPGPSYSACTSAMFSSLSRTCGKGGNYHPWPCGQLRARFFEQQPHPYAFLGPLLQFSQLLGQLVQCGAVYATHCCRALARLFEILRTQIASSLASSAPGLATARKTASVAGRTFDKLAQVKEAAVRSLSRYTWHSMRGNKVQLAAQGSQHIINIPR